jgi:hypothetical protein
MYPIVDGKPHLCDGRESDGKRDRTPNEIRDVEQPQGKGLTVGAGCGSTPQDLESESACRECTLHVDTMPDGRVRIGHTTLESYGTAMLWRVAKACTSLWHV